MKPPAGRASTLRRSDIRVLFDAAGANPGAIRLEVGEPSFTTPAHIIDAAMAAARAGHTGYGPNGGLASLRRLLAEKIDEVDGYRVEPSNVVVTPGGMNALFATYMALLEEGDEVLLPTPGFPNMDQMVRLLGGLPRFYRLASESGFLPDLGALETLINPRTKVLFINSPANPTGAVFPSTLVEGLVELVHRHDLWMISDEVYDEMILDPALGHTAAGQFDEDGRIISVYSFSKVYAMTGWRVGYAVAPAPIAEILRTLQEPQVSCPSTISQKAAEAALTGPREPIEAMNAAYRSRRQVALKVAEEEGLEVIEPGGTLYMMVKMASAGIPALEFALDLLRTREVSVAPGSVFGPAGEGWVRISLAAEEHDIDIGLRRLAAAVREAGSR